jgi:hypothetical protein
MKKTLTAALALTAFAGIAFADQEKATIDTQQAGCIEKTGSGLVCNPFDSFTNSVPKLGDIDGSALANGESISLVSPNGRANRFTWSAGGWYDTNNNCSNSLEFARGDAVYLNKTSNGHSLILAGDLTAASVDAKVVENGGYTFFGNASPVVKKLGDFEINPLGSYDVARDYVVIGATNTTKYVYSGGHWFTKEGNNDADSVDVAAGEGLFIFCKKRPRGWVAPSIKVPSGY